MSWKGPCVTPWHNWIWTTSHVYILTFYKSLTHSHPILYPETKWVIVLYIQTNQYIIFRLMIYVSKVSKLIIMCILTDTDTNKGMGKAQEHKPAGQHQCQAPNDKQRLGGEHETTLNNRQPAPPPFGLHFPQDTPWTPCTRTMKDEVNNQQWGERWTWVGMRLGNTTTHPHQWWQDRQDQHGQHQWQWQQQEQQKHGSSTSSSSTSSSSTSSAAATATQRLPPFVLFYLVFHLVSTIGSVLWCPLPLLCFLDTTL